MEKEIGTLMVFLFNTLCSHRNRRKNRFILEKSSVNNVVSAVRVRTENFILTFCNYA